MVKTKNMLDIYTKLYQMSDNIKGETLDYNRGFTDAVYQLSLLMKDYEHINLHIENRALIRKLFLSQIALDDKYEDRHILKQKVATLENTLQHLKKKEIVINSIQSEFVQCTIDIEDYKAEFLTTADQNTLTELMPLISDYILVRLSKKRRKHGPKHKTDYKVWCMEFLRSKGFKCIP